MLLVDDDAKLANAARRMLHKHMDLDTANDAASALETLRTNKDYTVVVCDHNMPGMSGAELLAQIAQEWPTTTRIMFTGDQDRNVASQAINSGQVFRLLNKPCEPDDLRLAITEGHKHHQLITAERDLLERTLSGSVKVLVDVLALSHPQAFAASQRTRLWARKMVKALGWSGGWEIGLGAMLWPLGDIVLPDEVIAKRDAGETLSEDDRAALDHAPEAAHALITNIPRLSGVADIIRRCRQGFDGSGPPGDGLRGTEQPKGARLLRVLIDLAAHPDTTTPEGLAKAREALARTPQLYDPDILAALSCLDQPGASPAKATARAVAPALLLEGDIIARDVNTHEGKLLLAAGSELTAPMIQKLRQIRRTGGVEDQLSIYRAA